MAINIIFLTLAILAAGAAAAKCVLPARPLLDTISIHGFALGVTSAALIVLLIDLTGQQLSFALATGALIVEAVLLWSWRPGNDRALIRAAKDKNIATTATGSKWWKTAVFVTLGCLLLLQLFFIGTEVALRPTYPWDAWRGWEPQAIQYFSNRALETEMPTIGNYGVISNYVHTLFMLATDSPTEPINHLPWLLTYCFLGMAIFGFLRSRSTLLALTTATFTLSIPILGTHAALAGYADLWLCFFFTLAAMSASKYSETRCWRYLLVTVIYCLACASTKRTGLGLGLIVLAVALWEFSASSLTLRRLILALTAFAALTALGIACDIIAIRWTLGGIGDILLSSSEIQLPGIRNYQVNVQLDVAPYVNALFQYGSFSMLGPLIIIFVGLTAFGGLRETSSSTMLTCTLYALLYFAFYFAVLSPASAADNSGLSRALLSVIPILIVQIAVGVDHVGKNIAQTNSSHQNHPAHH